MRPSRLAAALAFAAVATGCGSQTHADHPAVQGARPVLRGAASEEGPAASGRRLAWMQSAGVNPVAARSATDVFLREGARTRRVNPPGTHAETGGIGGRRLVLQLIRGGSSRLAVYDLRTHRLTSLPPFVNDGAWLWRPDIDGRRILYGAIVPGRATALSYEIRLADLDRGTVSVLARRGGHAQYAAPGQLRGDWATWVTCDENACAVWRENLATGRLERAPDTDRRRYSQFGPAVDRDGTVYFGRGLAGCGNGELRRWRGRRTSRMLRLPDDTAFQFAYLAKGSRTLYFDLVRCGRASSDIYAITVP